MAETREFKNLNVKFMLVNIGYILFEAGVLGFAYNYLSQSGFDDSTIGMTENSKELSLPR